MHIYVVEVELKINLGSGQSLIVKVMSVPSSSVSCKAGDVVSDKFPAGLRVLVVDDDPTCLRILEKMLRNCLYEVTKCNRAETALSLLREKRNDYDVVISDVHMPDMDGFKLLEQVGLLMDLPVIMMSADDSKSVVMKGVTHGACDYLIKPVRMEALKNIWQHVVRKKKHEWKEKKEVEQSGSVEDGDRQHKPSEDVDYLSSASEGKWKTSKKRKDEDDNDDDDDDGRDDTSTLKKPRVVWSMELHKQFVEAVNHLGIDKAVPKKILELMNVPKLTRENIASHLQKYRLFLRRLSGMPHNEFERCLSHSDTTFGGMSSFNGVDLQSLVNSGEISAQNLATFQATALGRVTSKSAISMHVHDQRNLFSFETPAKIRFGEAQNQLSHNNKQMSLLHGIPSNMESNKLSTLNSAHPFNSMNVGSQVAQMHRNQPQGRGQFLSETNPRMISSMGQNPLPNAIPLGLLNPKGIDRSSVLHPLSQPSSLGDFSMNQNTEFIGNGFPLVSNSATPTFPSKNMLQQEANMEIKGSSGFVPGYDIFNSLYHQNPQDWGHNVRSMFDISQHPAFQGTIDGSHSSGLTQQCFSSSHKGRQHPTTPTNKGVFSVGEGGQNNTLNIAQLNPFLADNSMRIKDARLSDSSFQSNLFSEQYGQDDLMTALLKQQHDSTNSVEGEGFGFDTV